jgi:hypothetical protein
METAAGVVRSRAHGLRGLGVSLGIAVGLSLALSVGLVHAFNADGLMLSVMSIQRPQLFYWAQDRYATFVPILTSPIRNPYANLATQVVLNALAFVLLLLVVAEIITRQLKITATTTDRLLAFVILVATTVLVIRPGLMAEISIGPQPYAYSYLFLALAMIAWFLADLPRPVALLLAGVLLTIAMGFNPSTLVAAGAILVFSVFVGDTRRGAIFFILAVGIFLVWMQIASAYPSSGVSYFALTLDGATAHLVRASQEIQYNTRFRTTIGIAGLALISGITARGAFGRTLTLGLVWLVLFGVGWWVAFSQSSWVGMNQFNSRYFFPSLFAVIITAATGFIAYAVQLPERWKRLAVVALVTGLATSLVLQARSSSGLDAVARVISQVDFARAQQIRYFVGDYWQVWPAVFALLDAPKPAFGLAWRGEANREALMASLTADVAARREVRALCLAQPAATCIDRAQQLTGLRWKAAVETCPGECTVLSAGRTSRAE